MLDSTEYSEFKNGKRQQTSIERTMSDHGSTEETETGISSENVEWEVFKIQTLTKEAVNEQIRGFSAPLARQLEELTRLVQGMDTTCHPNHYPRAEFGTNSGTAMPQSDMVTGVHRIRHGQRAMTNTDTDDNRTYPKFDRRFRPPTPPEKTGPFENLLDTITSLPSTIHTNNPRLSKRQAPTFKWTKDNFNEFEHLLKIHFSPMNHKLPDEVKLRYFQTFCREEATVFHQSLTITTGTNLNDVLTKFCRIYKRWIQQNCTL